MLLGSADQELRESAGGWFIFAPQLTYLPQMEVCMAGDWGSLKGHSLTRMSDLGRETLK